MAELKQINLRLEEKTMNEFRAFCESEGITQAQGFDHLMQVLELQRAKTEIPERLTEISEFERYIKSINDSYLTSLRIASEAEERVREEFRTNMKLREQALSEAELKLQNQKEKNKELSDKLGFVTKELTDAVKEKETVKKQLDSMGAILEEKEKVNQMLSLKLADADEAIVDYKKMVESETERKEELADALQKVQLLQLEVEQKAAIEAQLNEMSTRCAELADEVQHLKAGIVSAKRDLQEYEKLAEQEKTLVSERAIKETEQRMQEELAKLRDEKTRLEVLLEMRK